jgi:hypothetical protein
MNFSNTINRPSHIDASVITAVNNADYLLQSLIKLKGEAQNQFINGEIIGLTKMTVTQIIILKAPSFREGIDLDNRDPMSYVPDENRNLIKQYEHQLNNLDPNITKRYTGFINDPIQFIQLMIKELVEDSTYVLGIDTLPDESGFRAKEDELMRNINTVEEDKIKLVSGNEAIQYSYGKDLVWKYKILRLVL